MRAVHLSRLLLVLLAFGWIGLSSAANLGPEDRQVSITGAAGTTATDAVSPAVAYDSVNQRYLAVWSADETDGDFRIYGQVLSGAAGLPITDAFLVGDAGSAGSDNRQPAVAFDDLHQRYLVVWSSDGAAPGAYEIVGQSVSVDGQLVSSVRRFSDMGTTDTDTAFDAVTPDLVWHPGLGAFVVVWAGDDDTGFLSDGRFELYGQLVDGASGLETGANDFRISYAGPDANGNDATNPAIAITNDPQRWYVAFEGDVTDDGVHDTEVFMYGGTGDVPDPAATIMSAMGTGFNDGLSARNPDLAWAPSSGELICIWDGKTSAGTARAIYGQRALPDGTHVGSVLSLSFSVAGPIPLREAIEPVIAVNPVTDNWFVAWRGDVNDGASHYDHEVMAARFNDVGGPVEPLAYTLSDMDPSLGPVAGAGAPAVAINGTHGYKLVLWSGDLDTTPGGEHEIFAQGWSDDAFSGVDGPPTVMAFRLHGAVPNPFNPVTKIAFDLPAAGPVSLSVYDTAGRLVRTLLADEYAQAGRNDVVWNGRDNSGRQAASGVYLYRLETPTVQDVGRMTLVK